MEALLALGISPFEIVLVLIVSIPLLIKLVGWCKNVWKVRESFRQESITQGRQLERADEQEEERFINGESRIGVLEQEVSELKEIAQNQQKLIELLIQSDELDIKSWIKTQHERWIPLGYIDSQMLDLLEQRYKIYEREGGNSWAEKLVKEMRALPVVTVQPTNSNPQVH